MTATSLLELAGRVIRGWQRSAAEAAGTCDRAAAAPGAAPNPAPDDADLRDVFDSAVGGGDAWLSCVLAGNAQRTPPASGERVLAEAFAMGASADVVASFARSASYDSVNPAIIGDYRDRPKGNVFAGDVLWNAGFEVPTYDIAGAGGCIVGQHYKEAERWPKESAYFDEVTKLDDIRPGDVLVVDYKERHGASGGAHVEIITRADRDGDGLHLASMGARSRGLREDELHAGKLERATPCADHWDFPGDGKALAAHLYVLRPKRQRAAATADAA
jgi:hypothetical protein